MIEPETPQSLRDAAVKRSSLRITVIMFVFILLFPYTCAVGFKAPAWMFLLHGTCLSVVGLAYFFEQEGRQKFNEGQDAMRKTIAEKLSEDRFVRYYLFLQNQGRQGSPKQGVVNAGNSGNSFGLGRRTDSRLDNGESRVGAGQRSADSCYVHSVSPVCGNRNSNMGCDGEATPAGVVDTGRGEAPSGVRSNT